MEGFVISLVADDAGEGEDDDRSKKGGVKSKSGRVGERDEEERKKKKLKVRDEEKKKKKKYSCTSMSRQWSSSCTLHATRKTTLQQRNACNTTF